jgi:hypothetical protein
MRCRRVRSSSGVSQEDRGSREFRSRTSRRSLCPSHRSGNSTRSASATSPSTPRFDRTVRRPRAWKNSATSTLSQSSPPGAWGGRDGSFCRARSTAETELRSCGRSRLLITHSRLLRPDWPGSQRLREAPVFKALGRGLGFKIWDIRPTSRSSRHSKPRRLRTAGRSLRRSASRASPTGSPR